MKPLHFPGLPPITQRVLIAVAVLAVALIINSWHRNALSSLAILIDSLALAVWLGGEMSKPNDPHQ